MPINPNVVGFKTQPRESSWTSSSCLLYALGVGAGADDPTDELAFTTENSWGTQQQVLPTFAVVAAGPPEIPKEVGEYDPTMLLSGEHSITLHRPIPPEGTVRTSTTITGVFDKGSGAVITGESVSVDTTTGEPMFTNRSAVFIRGEGGFGGDRGPTAKPVTHDGPPDSLVTCFVPTDQALLYRLTGDRNPLHSDPNFAKQGGFDQPILHGLCTYGYAGRVLLRELCASDVRRFVALSARFSKPVLPGSELNVRIWNQSVGVASFDVLVDGEPVLDRGEFTYAQA